MSISVRANAADSSRNIWIWRSLNICCFCGYKTALHSWRTEKVLRKLRALSGFQVRLIMGRSLKGIWNAHQRNTGTQRWTSEKPQKNCQNIVKKRVKKYNLGIPFYQQPMLYYVSMETYRSGRNGADSKSVYRSNAGTRVRIPPSPCYRDDNLECIYQDCRPCF